MSWARLSVLQCNNMSHNAYGHGINLYDVIMTRVGNLHECGQSSLGHFSLLHRYQHEKVSDQNAYSPWAHIRMSPCTPMHYFAGASQRRINILLSIDTFYGVRNPIKSLFSVLDHYNIFKYTKYTFQGVRHAQKKLINNYKVYRNWGYERVMKHKSDNSENGLFGSLSPGECLLRVGT